MPLTKKTTYLLSPEQEQDVREELRQMELSESYNTTSSYVPASVDYPDGVISFVDRHIRYLKANPKLDARMYLANVRLKTRVR